MGSTPLHTRSAVYTVAVGGPFVHSVAVSATHITLMVLSSSFNEKTTPISTPSAMYGEAHAQCRRQVPRPGAGVHNLPS